MSIKIPEKLNTEYLSNLTYGNIIDLVKEFGKYEKYSEKITELRDHFDTVKGSKYSRYEMLISNIINEGIKSTAEHGNLPSMKQYINWLTGDKGINLETRNKVISEAIAISFNNDGSDEMWDFLVDRLNEPERPSTITKTLEGVIAKNE